MVLNRKTIQEIVDLARLEKATPQKILIPRFKSLVQSWSVANQDDEPNCFNWRCFPFSKNNHKTPGSVSGIDPVSNLTMCSWPVPRHSFFKKTGRRRWHGKGSMFNKSRPKKLCVFFCLSWFWLVTRMLDYVTKLKIKRSISFFCWPWE